MWIKLTEEGTKREIYINAKNIIFFQKSGVTPGTWITFLDQGEMTAEETPEEIIHMLSFDPKNENPF